MFETDLFSESGDRGKLAILIFDRHVAILQIIVGNPGGERLILPARPYRFQFAIGVHVKNSHGEVSANWLQEFGATKQARDSNECVVDHTRVDSRAPFGKLPISITIDALSQPVIDSVNVLRRWK